MKRVTRADLDRAVERLNKLFGYQTEPHTQDADGRYHPNPHVFTLNYAYGAVALHQMSAEGSGENWVLHRTSKRELLAQIHAFRHGAATAISRVARGSS